MPPPSPTADHSQTPTSPTSTAEACASAVPDKYGRVPLGACNSQYAYVPHFDAECAFAVLFGLTLAGHFVQAIVWKKKFCWVLLVGASWEFLAFLLKALGARDQQNGGYSTAGQLLFLLAPLWINAFCYMTIARLVYFTLPDQSVFKTKAPSLTKIFVWIDVFCLVIQATGGMMMSTTDLSPHILKIGQDVYLGGCGAQLGFILCFCSIIARLYIKMGKSYRPHCSWGLSRALLFVMSGVLLLIIARIIFRLVEFSPGSGSDNSISSNEYYALFLDALPMFLALLLLNAVHPGWVLQGPDSEFPPKPKKAKKVKRSKKDKKQKELEGGAYERV